MQVDSLSAEPPRKPKNTGVGSLSFLQQIFPTQVSNLGLLHCRWILYHLSYQGRLSLCIYIIILILWMRKLRHKEVVLLLQQEDWDTVPRRLAREAAFSPSYHLTPKDLNTSPLPDYSIYHPSIFHLKVLYLNTLSSSLPGTGGGKLNPPPAPPARSPTTELSSRSQQALAWTPTQQPGGQLRNGSLNIIGEWGKEQPTGCVK